MIQKFEDRNSANTMLTFNPSLKDMEMCMEQKFTNLEAVQLIKDDTIHNVRGTVEFYLNTNSTWEYQDLIEHFRTLFEFGENLACWLEIFTVKYNGHGKEKISLPRR